MSRIEHLRRNALGRSAFQRLDHAVSSPAEDFRAHAVQNDSPSSARRIQQYDAKGRPINPAAETAKADIREAQNEVLALVDIVERKQISTVNNADHTVNSTMLTWYGAVLATLIGLYSHIWH